MLDEPTHIEVSSGLPPPEIDDEKFLSVALLDEATGQSGAAVFGTYTRDGARLVFRPRFALASGAHYRISAGGEHVDHLVVAPAASAPTIITSVSPAANEVPANLLKFYLHFSRPMREGREIFEHISLVDEAGEPIPAPWRDTELWAEDARRLTLWIHPGRVKRGVNLREELGPVLRPGATYTLIVDAATRDASGQPLGREFRHRFRATAEAHARLDLAAWTLDPPPAGTREPLRVTASTAVDAVIARRTLHVRTTTGDDLEGMATLTADGRAWTFIPREPWPASALVFMADPWLEDLAGNNFARIFDDDVTEPVPPAPPQTKRPFTPRPP